MHRIKNECITKSTEKKITSIGHDSGKGSETRISLFRYPTS